MGGSSGKGGSSSTKVFRYHAAVQFILGQFVADSIKRITFGDDDRIAWEGDETGSATGYGTITVNKMDLYGGDKKEGGVAGQIDVGVGHITQPRNSFLQSVLGALTPARRGLTSMIFKDFYWGNNPYPKSPKVRVQSIHKMWDGSEQWYDEKAGVLTVNTGLGLALGSTSDGWSYLVTPLSDSTDYSSSSFDDSGWSVGQMPFASAAGQPYAVANGFPSTMNTYWPLNTKIWLRKRFTLTQAAKDITLTIFIDNFADVWVNNIKVLNSANTTQSKVTFTVPASILTVGTNTIVMRGTDDAATGGGDYTYAAFLLVQNNEDAPDINPAHFIREIHTNPLWGAGFPESIMGNSYYEAADLFFNEGLGISPIFTERLEYGEMISEVIRHVDAIAYEDMDTGLFEIKPLRGDYDIESLLVLDESNSELEYITRPDDFELYNQVIVTFWNREISDDDTVTVTNDAAIDLIGYVKAKEIEYPFFTTTSTAMIAAQRDLSRLSKPFAKGKVRVNRFAFSLKEGDVFIGNWPSDNIIQMVCRVAKRQEQGLAEPEIIIEFGEDVFGADYSTFSVPPASTWSDPVGNPRNFSHATAFELPYYLAVQEIGENAMSQVSTDSACYAFAGTEPDSGAHTGYDLYAYSQGITQEPDTSVGITSSFTPFAIVSAIAGPLDTTISVEAIYGMDSVKLGHLILVGDGYDSQREMMVLDNDVNDGDALITVRRGVIDTVPMREIAVGTVLYFIETFYGRSTTEFTAGEVIEGYGAPVNGRGYYAGPYDYFVLDLVGRIGLPYPPGNLLIDGQSYPNEWFVPQNNQVTFTWVYRDRVIQSNQAIDHYDAANYGPETGTTFLVEVDALNHAGSVLQANWLSCNVGLTNSFILDLDTDIAPVGTSILRVRIFSIRNDLKSLQAPSVTFFMPGTILLTDEFTGKPILDIDGNYMAGETI